MSDDRTLEFLATNGLFCCNGINDIFCSICATDARLDSWEKHIIDPTHVQTLEQFNQIFERIATRSHCRLCGEDFDWRVLKNHARSHTILPWHRPYDEYDKYKIFFDNRIIEWKSLFHCCICNVTFSTFDVAFLHIADPTHQSRKEKIASLVYQFPTDAVTYDFLVSECLITSTETALECRICGSTKVSVDNVSRHVKALMHQSNRLKFRLELIERKAKDPVAEPTNDHLQSEESSKDSGSEESAAEDSSSKKSTPENVEAVALTDDREIVPQSSACNYIVKHSTTDSYCIICNCVLFHHSINNHIRDKDHVDALKAYGCDEILLNNNNSEYYCRICNRSISGPANVYSHIVGNKHLKSLNTSREDRVGTRPNEVRMIKRPAEDTKKVSDPEGSNHAESREKDNSDNISLLEDNGYYCRCCNVTISGPENLYRHLKGKRHLHSCNLSERQQARLRPDRFETLRRPNMNLGTGKDSLPSLPNTFGKQLIGTGSLEMPKRRDGNVLKTVERRSGLPDTFDKPQTQMEKRLDSLKISDVDSQTKEEHYSTWENTFGLQHVEISRDNVDTPTCPAVVFHGKDERRADSPTEIGKRQAQRTGPPVIPRSTEHFPDRIIENLKIPNVNSQTKEEHYPTWENTFGLQQVGISQDSSEPSTRPEVVFHTKDEHRVDSPNEIGKRQAHRVSPLMIPRRPKHIPERIFETLKMPNVNSQRKEEYHPTWDNIFGLQQAGISRDNFDTPTTPEVVVHAKDEGRSASPNETDKRRAQRAGPLAIPRRPEHLPKRVVENSTCDYLVRLDDLHLRCEICDCTISRSSANINLHVTGNYHIASLKKYGCNYVTAKGDDIYYCECCDVAMVHPENVYLHIKNDGHINFVTELNRQQLSMHKKNPEKVVIPDRIPEKSERLPESACPTSPSIYVMKKSATVFHCELCDVDLVGSSETSNHIAGADHAATMEKHGCASVVMVDGDDYYCVSCKCHICGCENVYLHVKGRRHFFGLHHLPDRQQLQVAKRNINKLKTSEGPESNTELSLVTTEMTKMMKKWRILEKKSRQN